LNPAARLPATSVVVEMLKTRKYRELREYLEGLGFIHQFVEGSHRSFTHAKSGTVFLFGGFAIDDAPVRAEDLISVRRHLVDNGIVSEQEFATFLKRGMKPGRRSTIARKKSGESPHEPASNG